MKNWRKILTNQWFFLSTILIIAAFLRLYRIDVLMRFIWDEGRDMLAIRNIIVNRDLTLFGPFNEIGGHIDFFGVFHYYLMLPALWLANFDPVGPAIFTALLGVTTIGLAYYWLKGWLKKEQALAICALMAMSPLVARFNQWPWNPNTTGFFAILYLISLQKYQAPKTNKKIWIMAAGLFLGLLFQLHYFTIALTFAAIIIFFKQNKKDWLGAIIFICAFILPNLTFVIFDLTHAGFYSKIITESFFGSSNQKFFIFSWSNLFTGPLKYLVDVSSKFFGSKILGFSMTGVWIYYAWQTLKKFRTEFKNQKQAGEETQLIMSWLAFLLLTGFFPTLVDDHHSSTLWISFALAVIYTLQRIFKKHWQVLLIFLLGWMIYANHFWREPNWQENMPRLRQAALAIAKNAKLQKNEKINVASFVDSGTNAIRFRYFITNAGQALLGFDDYPRSDILYVITPHSWAETSKNPAWELDTFRQASATAIWSDEDWTVFRASKTY